MRGTRWLPIDRRQTIAALLALAIVASVSGAATTALLSDREDVSVELAVEQSAVSSFHVEPLATCEPVTVGNGAELKQIEQVNVEGDGCARISVWVSEGWVEQSAGDVTNVVIGHKRGSAWSYFQTTVVSERNGWYKLRATTDGFSPFGLFVANESATASGGGSPVTAESDVTDVGPNESASGNSTATVNGSIESNGTVANVTDAASDTVSTTQNGTTSGNGSSTVVGTSADAGENESTTTTNNQSTTTSSNQSTATTNEESTANESVGTNGTATVTGDPDQPTVEDETETATASGTANETDTETESTASGGSASLSRVVRIR